jgi:hypothetical protein
MKTTRPNPWLATDLPAPTTTDETAARPGKIYTGTIVSIEPKEPVVNVRGAMGFKKAFTLGCGCACRQLDKNVATAKDLRPGERVAVRYQDIQGVLIANRFEQEPMLLNGMVKALDAQLHTLTLHRTALDKHLQLADDCQVRLRAGKIGTFDDIKIGNHVTVIFETPDDQPTAREIAQTSVEFAGTLTAIDLEERTLKARGLTGTRKFNVAANCAIVIDDEPDGRLADLRLYDSLLFSYQEVDGVNVVDRIALSPMESLAANAMPGFGPMGQPLGF